MLSLQAYPMEQRRKDAGSKLPKGSFLHVRYLFATALYSRHRWPPRGGPPADQRPRRRHQTHLRGNSLSASAPGNGPIHTPLQQANASCCLRRRHRRAIGLTRRSSCGSSLVPGRRCGKCTLGTRYYRFSRARWWAVTSHVLHVRSGVVPPGHLDSSRLHLQASRNNTSCRSDLILYRGSSLRNE